MSSAAELRRRTLVVVDDDWVELQAVRRGLERMELPWDLRDFEDARDALEALADLAPVGSPSEDLFVLLDLNMPGMSGVEFLERLRADPRLADVRVVVLTTSDDPRDAARTHELGALAYLVKGDGGDDYVTALSILQRLWDVMDA